MTFEEASKSTRFCLELTPDGTFRLRPDHSYYYQVQLQMKICDINNCHFVVWSPNELVVLKIVCNNDFLYMALPKAYDFFKNGILPELINKWYSRAPKSVVHVADVDDETSKDNDSEWCYCRGSADHSGEMIGCDSESCQIQWFHMSCLNMDEIPDGDWFCPECRLPSSSQN